jgi:Kef-type K+ transport system membrane component KefB
MPDLSPDVMYVLLIFGIFIVSRYLERFRIPSAITCVGIGVGLGVGLGAFTDAPTVKIFAVLGIVSLFLFAGMEVDLEELKRGRAILAQHLVIRASVIAGATMLIQRFLGLELRAAVLVALALLTPSTGFILSSLASLDLSDAERFWIKSKAIATEIVALAALFIALQSTSPETLGLSVVALLLMILLLPVIFKMFARAILPYAPNTEFAFLVIVALLCASLTKKLGVYYLVGAFVVGVTEQRLRSELPALATEGLMRAVELFASFFIPFYFLEAGLTLTRENFSPAAIELAGIFIVCALPAQLVIVALHRRIALKEPMRAGFRVGASLLPTLVFSMVLAGILRERFAASPALVGAIIIYALINTLLPGLFLRTPVPDYDSPVVPRQTVEMSVREHDAAQ